ncbi:nuclear transport factor 2 family protein [Mesorhizobium atlanticum]
MRAVEIVSNLYKAYADRDIEGALSRCAEDVVFRWIADPRQSRHAGTAHGKQEFLSRLLRSTMTSNTGTLSPSRSSTVATRLPRRSRST